MVKKFYILILILFFISFFIHIYKFEIQYSNQKFNKKRYVVMILDKLKEKEDYKSYLVKLNNDRFLLNVYEDDNIYFNGDKLLINSYILVPDIKNNLYEFNYKRYLNSENIIGIMNTDNIEKIEETNSLFKSIQKFREYLNFKISANFEVKNASFLKTVIYSEKIDNDILNTFTKIGLNHVLSISGFNVYILSTILKFILNKLKIKSKKIKLILKSIIYLLYLILCSFKISLLRSILYTIIIEVLYINKMKVNRVNILIILAISFVIYNPYIIFSPSFILSFLASFSIAIFTPYFNSYIDSKIKKKNIFFNKVLIKILKNIAIFISVQILILPIQVMYFNKFSLISLLSNIILLPIISIQLVLAILLIPFYNIDIIIIINKFILNILFYLSDKFENIAIEISLASFTYKFIIAYYIVVFIIFNIDKIRYRLFLKNKLPINITKYLLTIYMIYEIIYMNYFISFEYHFNVGQGNMSLFKYNNTSIITDCGSTTDYRVGSYLIYLTKALNINKIDAIVISHFHEDHVNAIEYILKNKKVEYIIYETPKINKDISKYTNLFKEYNVKEIKISGRDIIKIGEVTIDVYSNDEIIESDNLLNSNSLISLISYNNKNSLFLGDSTKETEIEYMKDINSFEDNKEYLNKLKNLNSVCLGHHGSKTSSCEEFISLINAKIAIMSSDIKKYGHPNKEVIDRLNIYNMKYFATTYENKGKMIK